MIDAARARLHAHIDYLCRFEAQRIARDHEHHRRALGQLFRLDRFPRWRPPSRGIIYVRSGGSNTAPYNTWERATTLTTALALANSGDRVHIALEA